MDLDFSGGLLSDGPLVRLIGHCVLTFAALAVLRHAFAHLLVAVFVVIGASLGPRFVICPYRKSVPRLQTAHP
jgi:Flp pilus assembly protein TadB